MKRHLTLTLLSLILPSLAALAQDGGGELWLDTVSVRRKFVVNDYSLIGFEYGATLNTFSFSPSRTTKQVLIPEYYGVTWTRYGKLFGFMPYFGVRLGLFYGHEAYQFKEDREKGYTQTIEGATKAVFDVVEVPFQAVFHYDMAHFKLLGALGMYGGYRLRIERTGEDVDADIRNDFLDTDRRLDYGIKGGVGFGLVFDPVEFHVKGEFKYGWGTLYEPDYNSKYYYRFAYPMDIAITAGVYVQLTRRSGKTRRQLRREAYGLVYTPTEDGAARETAAQGTEPGSSGAAAQGRPESGVQQPGLMMETNGTEAIDIATQETEVARDGGEANEEGGKR